MHHPQYDGLDMLHLAFLTFKSLKEWFFEVLKGLRWTSHTRIRYVILWINVMIPWWLKKQSDLLATFPKRLIKMESKKGSKMGWTRGIIFFSDHLSECGKNRRISLCRYIFGRGLWKHGSCDCCGRVSLFALGFGVARWPVPQLGECMHQNSLVCLFWICQLKKIMETNRGFWGWNFLAFFRAVV